MKIKHLLIAGFALYINATTAAPRVEDIALITAPISLKEPLVVALETLCTNEGFAATVFPPTNQTYPTDRGRTAVTVVCATTSLNSWTYSERRSSDFIPFAGTGFKEVRINFNYGSFGVVKILAGDDDLLFFDPASNLLRPPPTGAFVLGGISGIDNNEMPSTTIGAYQVPAHAPIATAEIYGVAASAGLYNKLFLAQQAAGDIPTTCSITSTAIPYCIPSISKGQMASIMGDNDFNAAYTRGLAFLTDQPIDERTELRYVRMSDYSSEQAVAQIYFSGLPCSKSALSIAPEPTGHDEAGGLFDRLAGSIRLLLAPTTDEARRELNKPGNTYALAVLSGTNTQGGSALENWRWLRIDGMAMGDADPNRPWETNRSRMKKGLYDFYFTHQWAPARNNWGSLSSIVSRLGEVIEYRSYGLVGRETLDFGFTKSGQTCAMNSSN
jgi:hypothetical protein